MDRADEFQLLEDLWPEVAASIWSGVTDAVHKVREYALDLDDHNGVQMMRSLEAKFRRGEAEHERDWLNMTRAQLEAMALEEIQDLVLYLAMIDARWPEPITPSPLPKPVDAPPFATNQDPGDETSERVAA